MWKFYFFIIVFISADKQIKHLKWIEKQLAMCVYVIFLYFLLYILYLNFLILVFFFFIQSKLHLFYFLF